MASSAEIHPNNDRTPDAPAKNTASSLDNIDRIKVLASMDIVKPGQPTAKLSDFYLDGKDPQQTGDVQRFVAKPENAASVAAPKQVAARTDAPKPAEQFSQESAISTLQSANATAQQKIEAVSKLYDSMPKDGKGRVHLTIHDGDKDKQFEISKEKLGHGVNLTHLTYKDEKGHVHPVLRGVERKGHIDQENDKNGNKADFKGDWWSKHAESSVISQFAPSTDKPVAPVPPEREKSVEPAPLPPRREKPHPSKEVPLPPERDPRSGEETPAGQPTHRLRHRHPEKRNPAGEEPNPVPGTEPRRAEPRKTEPEQRIKPEKEERPERQNGEFVKPSDLHNFWVVQPSKFECGSSAEAMAISKVTGRAPFSAGEIHQLSRENGSLNSGAFPHGAGNRNMEEQLKAHGVNAETHNFSGNPREEMNKLDEELAKGHHAVAYIRNPATGNGHFIFIDGKTEDGKYVVGNSGRHTFRDAPPVGRRELESWMLGEKRGSPYFVSVW